MGRCCCSFLLCYLNPRCYVCTELSTCMSTAGPVYIRREKRVMGQQGIICFCYKIWCRRQSCSVAVLEITATSCLQFSVLLNRFHLVMYTTHILSNYFGSTDKLASYLCWKYECSVANGVGTSCFFLAMSPHLENN